MSDRVNTYFNNNQTLCQPNCKFSDYSVEEKLLKCTCDLTNSEIDTRVIKKFSKKTAYESFYDTLKFSNYKVLYCYKLAFHINSITVNKGSIIAIILFCFYFIFFLIYCIEGIRRFKIEIARWIFIRRKKYNFSEQMKDNIIEMNEKK